MYLKFVPVSLSSSSKIWSMVDTWDLNSISQYYFRFFAYKCYNIEVIASLETEVQWKIADIPANYDVIIEVEVEMGFF